MRKILNKIVCLSVAAVAAAGIFTVSACSDVYNTKPLKNYTSSTDKAVSNGGFAVEKGDYIYFINGQEANSADNSFGSVVKGAVMRISKSDFSSRNYANVDTVVPQVVYSGNTNAGIFVYGDYIYYATPSTEKDSDGKILNSNLDFKRTKLDGTSAMKNYFVQLSDNSAEYRYVEVDGTVYLLYVVTESLYGTSCTNLHSVNTSTGADTLLAYNVDSVTFDSGDVTNPRVFYTMSVTEDYLLGTVSSYNQIYTVTADATVAADYSEYFKEVYKDTDTPYDASSDPKYVNCGTLVLDGFGYIDGIKENLTVFNGEDAEKVVRSAYSYSLSSYQSGVLLYTREDLSVDISVSLFSSKVEEEILASGWNPVTANDSAKYILQDGSAVSSFTFIFDDNSNIENVLIADGSGFIKTKLGTDGEILTKIDNKDTFYMTLDGQPTVLFTQSHNGVNYIYYSLDGGNGYTVNRISYSGDCDDYYNPFGEAVSDYTPVSVLDLDTVSDWYKPEMLEGQILFPTQTDNMTSYPYIMVCDLRVRADGSATAAVMDNVQLDELNEKYDGITENIEGYDEEEDIYKNLQNALWYAHFTGDIEYIEELIKAYEGEDDIWSETAVGIINDFVATENDWSDYANDKITVNGVEVAANRRDYYYALLGKMNASDAEAYAEGLKDAYLQSYPETEESWFESLSTAAKVGFIIGVCAGGLIIIGAAAVTALVIIRKQKAKLPVYTKKRIKVDTTDDKNIDVYSDEQ